MKKALETIGEVFGVLAFITFFVFMIAFAGIFMFYAGGWIVWFFLQLPHPTF